MTANRSPSPLLEYEVFFPFWNVKKTIFKMYLIVKKKDLRQNASVLKLFECIFDIA